MSCAAPDHATGAIDGPWSENFLTSTDAAEPSSEPAAVGFDGTFSFFVSP